LLEEARRHQVNMEAVTAEAIRQLPADAQVGDISIDWLDQFFAAARGISEQEKRLVWAKMLAIEATDPGSISPRALETIRLFSRKDAETLREIASRTIYLDGRPISVNDCFFNPDPDPLDHMRRATALGLISDLRGSETTPIIYPEVGTWTELASFQGGVRVLLRRRRRQVRIGTRTGGFALTDLGRELVALPDVAVSHPMLRRISSEYEKEFEVRVEDSEGRLLHITS